MVARLSLVLGGDGLPQQLQASDVLATGYSLSTKTAGYTETALAGRIIALCSLTAGFTVILPTVVGNTAELIYQKVLAAGSITLQAAGGQTVQGNTTLVLTGAGQTVNLFSDGISNWVVI